ncbi:Crocetin glucosyltransferase, chloroplastic [Ananas comosus]|uniref:Crocetin glucosyltransferase, chloroplastic n=1 Tax=Ananas comosus TaxID=4615 RepID=A0A199W8B8_ANACO|nr:Crocetin glucosyltransferase, chloroplastic [Ananas comosus]
MEAKQQQQQQQQQQQHFLVVAYPNQGLINPARVLAERLAASSCAVTFSTAISAHRRMFPSLPSPDHPVHLAGISFAPYSDGFDAGFRWFVDDLAELNARVAELGPRTLGAVLDSLAARGRPVTRVVYTMALPWVADVARSRGLPAALFWVQPAAVLALYYHYNSSSAHYDRLIAESSAAATVEFPGLPGFEIRELPSVLTNTSDETSRVILQILREAFDTLESESKEKTTPPPTKVLVNTFEALEREALETVRGRCGIDAVAVGPLIKGGAGGDLFEAAEERRYMEWLDAQAEGSVVYVSFGSLAVMKGRQMEEMRAGLRLLGRPYLWVVRRNNREEGERVGLKWDEEEEEQESAGGMGMVVEWCEQVKVLSHRAVGCFVTHCGWNSTLEGVACGVPAVAAPQIVEQHTNAALLEKRFGTGVRAEMDAEGVLLRDELRRCVDFVMRDEGIRARAEMWREKAREAVEQGGSSDRELRRFVEEAKQQQQQHFLVVAHPNQGLINPARVLAERLTASSCGVTFSTAVSAHRRMFPSLPSPDHPVHLAGISFVPYSDGFDAGFRLFVDDFAELYARAAELGPRTLGAVLDSLAARGRPVTRVVYTMAVPWVADVARRRGLPAALFWVQPAAVLALHYHYNRSSDHYDRLIAESSAAATVEFPGLPGFEIRDLPSVLTNTSDETSRVILQILREAFETLESESKESTTPPPRTKVLVNTFEALEREALETVRGRCGIDAVAVGPLIKGGAGGDLFEAAEERRYMEWLDAQAERSVVYVSFGSLAVMKGRQMEEMRAGLRLLGRPYLWVVRRNNREEGERVGLEWDEEEEEEESAGGGMGMVVEWCEQVKVLSHRAVGCFVTHCGWNSTLEGVACGVPAVAAPQMAEQQTNAALLEKRFGTGVRAETDAEGVLLRDEFRRCVDFVMRDEGIRARAQMWREKAREAVEEGGSSDRALRLFVETDSKISPSI